MIDSEPFAKAAQAIQQASCVAIACHEVPDGDAIGSLLAFYHLCTSQGKRCIASWPEPFEIAPHYEFMPELDSMTRPSDFPEEPEVMIALDCGSLDRLGSLAEKAKAAKHLIIIDHHETNCFQGEINLIYPNAAATVVLLRRLLKELAWPLDQSAALCLYVGLVTDTFRFTKMHSSPEVFELAKELSEYGLDLSEINRKLFEEHHFNYMKLIGRCLSKLELNTSIGFAYTTVSLKDFQEFNVRIEEAEGLIDLVGRISEAKVYAVLKEAPNGIRVSLRSKDPSVDVGMIAALFGGGGHRFSAGFVSLGEISEVVNSLTKVLANNLSVES